MDIELLVVPDCPNAQPATQLVRRALDDAGLNRLPITTTVVSSQAEAERRGFPGSPTILINGADPFAEPDRPASLACRLYRHQGRISGVPDLGTLREGIERAAADNTP